MPPPRSSAVSIGKASPRREGLSKRRPGRLNSLVRLDPQGPTAYVSYQAGHSRVWPQARYDEELASAQRALRDDASFLGR